MNKTIIDIDFEVQDNSWPDMQEISLKTSQTALDYIGLTKIAKHIEFAIILTDNDKMRAINSEYRNKDYATNTLSFPSNEIDPKNLEKLKIDNEFIYLGDIIFSYMVIKEEADAANITFENHYSHLLVHSLLHLLGYDHIDDLEAENMENLETEVLSKLNIKSPYN